jgi:hypothetical protein
MPALPTSIRAGATIENPVTGETISFIRTAAETDGVRPRLRTEGRARHRRGGRPPCRLPADVRAVRGDGAGVRLLAASPFSTAPRAASGPPSP